MNDIAQNHSMFRRHEKTDFDSFVSKFTYSNDTDTSTAAATDENLNRNMLLTGFMMGLVAVFSLALCYMILPLFLHWVRRKIPISAAQINRRYETVEGWLITKVSGQLVESQYSLRLTSIPRLEVDALIITQVCSA
jgi:hypothetical protein